MSKIDSSTIMGLIIIHTDMHATIILSLFLCLTAVRAIFMIGGGWADNRPTHPQSFIHGMAYIIIHTDMHATIILSLFLCLAAV